ncbi:MAG: hypothetical protein V1789_01350 [PVC group bacterium]
MRTNGMIIAVLAALVMVAGGCSVGYGTKVGSAVKSISHSGYSYDQIFDAAEAALDELGVVTAADRTTGIIEGQIPPYRVKAILEEGSSWLKLEGVEEEEGAWKRGTGKGEWFLSMLDGTFRYRQGAETLQEAVDDWSKAINRRIP